MNRRLLIIVLMACLLPLGMQAQQGTFRFAQLTDIHLTPNNPNPTEDLLRSVAQINATDSIDFVPGDGRPDRRRRPYYHGKSEIVP